MIRSDREEQTTRIVLDRPGRGNALDGDGLEALAAAFEDAEGTVVLAGAGDAFCTGGDLAALADAAVQQDAARRFAERLVGAFDAVERHPAPVIAAVDGSALGGGFELVVAADLAVAAERASLGLPETRVGLTTPLTSERVAAIAGKKRTMRLALTDEAVDAATAERWGLVNDAVPASEVEPRVAGYVERLAAADTDALAATKRRAVASLRDDGWRDRAVDAMAERLTADGTEERLREAVET